MYHTRIIFTLVTLLSMNVLCFHPATVSGSSDTVTNFTLPDLSGKSVSLSEFIGKKVILINFWATWCIPCQQEMPHLEKLHQKLKDKDFVILAISIDKSSTQSKVRPFIKSRGYTFMTLLDKDSQVMNIFNPKVEAPYTVLIGKDGQIHYRHAGYSTGDAKLIEDKVMTLLGEGVEE